MKQSPVVRSILVFAAGAAGFMAQSCSSPHPGTTDYSALETRPSYTDQASRIRAENTLKELSQADEDYRLGPEDVIEINIFEWELSEKTKTVPVRVAQTGVISLPMIGDLQASGKTVWELKNEIEARLREGGYIRQPQVSVIIKEFHSKKIAVVGAVNNPGVYTIERNVTTLLDVLSLSGGLDEHAGQMLYVIRREPIAAPGVVSSTGQTGDQKTASQAGRPTTITIDLHELMERCDLSLNLVLRNGDIVSVPQAEQFFVYGYVLKPGGFDLRKPTTVLEAIAMAHGVDEDRGSPEYCMLKRRLAGKQDQLIPLNLQAIREGKEPNIYLQSNDIVDVRRTWAKGLGIGLGKLFGGVGVGLGYSLNN